MKQAFHPALVVWDLFNLLLSIPILVLHELAHYVACVPFGGPDGVYYIRDPSRPGIRGRLPVGAAIYHQFGDHAFRPIISLAPLAYLVLLGPIGEYLTSPWGMMAGMIVFLAGVVGFFDALNCWFPNVYAKLLDPERSHEAVLLIDLTPWTGGEAPKRQMMR